MLADAHRAPIFPLSPFLAHLAATWFPLSHPWTGPNEPPPGAYLPPMHTPRPRLINRAV